MPSAATSLTLGVAESIASYHDNQCQMAVILSDITLRGAGCVLAFFLATSCRELQRDFNQRRLITISASMWQLF